MWTFIQYNVKRYVKNDKYMYMFIYKSTFFGNKRVKKNFKFHKEAF